MIDLLERKMAHLPRPDLAPGETELLKALDQRWHDQAVHHMLTRELTLDWVTEAVPFDPMKYGGNPRVFGAAVIYQRWQ